MSVHPLHIDMFELNRNRLVQVYPYQGDAERLQFSRLIAPQISEDWCREYNAQCDPEDFDVSLTDRVVVNEVGKVLGFEVVFDAEGFGDAAQQQVPRRAVAYFFRERRGGWEHREFELRQLQHLFGSTSIRELVSNRPDAVFEAPVGG